jgi:hypothetical protein
LASGCHFMPTAGQEWWIGETAQNQSGSIPRSTGTTGQA